MQVCSVVRTSRPSARVASRPRTTILMAAHRPSMPAMPVLPAPLAVPLLSLAASAALLLSPLSANAQEATNTYKAFVNNRPVQEQITPDIKAVAICGTIGTFGFGAAWFNESQKVHAIASPPPCLLRPLERHKTALGLLFSCLIPSDPGHCVALSS